LREQIKKESCIKFNFDVNVAIGRVPGPWLMVLSKGQKEKDKRMATMGDLILAVGKLASLVPMYTIRKKHIFSAF
jgi:hypothetical protein